MGRLRPEALIGNEAHNLHYVQDCLHGEGPDPLSGSNYGDSWSRFAKRSRDLDPDGSKAYAILRTMHLRSIMVNANIGENEGVRAQCH